MNEINYENEISKKRKTTHTVDSKTIKNTFKIYDTKDTYEDLDMLDNLHYFTNVHKKRRYSKIDSDTSYNESKIPKFFRNVNVIYSKYSDYPTKLPKYENK